MSSSLLINPIGIIHSPYKEKFSIPRQPGLAQIESTIELHPPFNRAEALIGLEDFSHLWVIFSFHGLNQSDSDSLTVRPPRLGGNKRLGIFATRSPFRPNSLGLSLVKIKSFDNKKINIIGGDFLDQTPIYDLKPYLQEIESIPNARSGWTDQLTTKRLNVVFECDIQENLKNSLHEILSLDPRPSYHQEGQKTYGSKLFNYDVFWKVENNTLIVLELKKLFN